MKAIALQSLLVAVPGSTNRAQIRRGETFEADASTVERLVARRLAVLPDDAAAEAVAAAEQAEQAERARLADEATRTVKTRAQRFEAHHFTTDVKFGT